jgi:hypothetical protein
LKNIAPVHESVQRIFVSSRCRHAEFAFYPVHLDVKQTEVLRTLFVDEDRSRIVAACFDGTIPVFLAGGPATQELFCINRPPVSIFLDLHDTGYDFMGLTRHMWETVVRYKLHIIYLKLQIHDRFQYQALNLLPKQVHVISCPLLLGGSRYHITTQVDFEGESLFRRTMRPNPYPVYEYDWSWVGSLTGQDRQPVFERLKNYTSRKRFFVVSKPGHPNANAASVPYPTYIQICRSSKICLSLNGNGPWCLKDGELFTNHCFNLRQWHPTLTVNPLSPKDGVHWAVFRNDEVIKMIEYYLHHEGEREQIRNKGYELFRDVLFNGLWARYYIEKLSTFLRCYNKDAWGELAIA